MDLYLVDLIGYLGTFLVLLSMTMTSMKKLRLINITGSAASAIYAILCNTWPVVVLNIGMIVINSFQLLRAKRAAQA